MIMKLIILLENCVKLVLIAMVIIYRYSLSVVIKSLMGEPCRFHPTCSMYALICLKQDRLFIALIKIIKRLLKCHPWHPGGVDLP